MIDAKEWLKSPKAERQQHLQLDEPCLERGGNSTNHRGVLAQYLDTNIPAGHSVNLAHACNNGSCSNPRHLYWSTKRENVIEDNPNWKSAWENSVEKYGYDEACKRNQRPGNSFGKSNAGKSKSDLHKQNISRSLKERNK